MPGRVARRRSDGGALHARSHARAAPVGAHSCRHLAAHAVVDAAPLPQIPHPPHARAPLTFFEENRSRGRSTSSAPAGAREVRAPPTELPALQQCRGQQRERRERCEGLPGASCTPSQRTGSSITWMGATAAPGGARVERTERHAEGERKLDGRAGVGCAGRSATRRAAAARREPALAQERRATSAAERHPRAPCRRRRWRAPLQRKGSLLMRFRAQSVRERQRGTSVSG